MKFETLVILFGGILSFVFTSNLIQPTSPPVGEVRLVRYVLDDKPVTITKEEAFKL
jgi:hypothetical protein